MPHRYLIVALFLFAGRLPGEDSTVQPSPEETAAAAGVTLPKLPWHVMNIWWDFEKSVEHFASLEADVISFWAKHSAFVQVYSTARIPRSDIPKVNVTFGWPRINGRKVALKRASAYYPHDTGPAAPDCAWVKTNGASCLVEVGPIPQRNEAKRRHDLDLKLIP